jgi:hypothetical protein
MPAGRKPDPGPDHGNGPPLARRLCAGAIPDARPHINPAVAVAAGVTLLAEPFTATIAVSFALILTGCLLATGPRHGQPPEGTARSHDRAGPPSGRPALSGP